MTVAPSSSPAKGPGRKLDVSQVSLSLQDRLGLAKVRYERTHRQLSDHPQQQRQHNGDGGSGGEMLVSDASSDIRDNNRYETPFTSSPLPTPVLSKELPRSTRSKHAATFNPDTLGNLSGGSRKRLRSDSLAEQPSKVPRISWKDTHGLAQSSPTLGSRHSAYRDNHTSFVSQSDTIPEEDISPTLHRHSDENNDHDLPSMTRPDISSSLISSSPPRTPPPNRNRVTRSAKDQQNENGEDGADLLLYLANSPTPATFGGKNYMRDFLPSTPPSQHAALPSLTSTPGGGVTANFATPNQPFNFADFVNVTPSPAQLPWSGRTPRALSKTPRAMKEPRKHLNFDSLAPPSGSPASRAKKPESTLQLGEELRP